MLLPQLWLILLGGGGGGECQVIHSDYFGRLQVHCTQIRITHAVISDHLDEQREQLQTLLSDFGDMLSNKPGRMTITEHNIDTGDANPYIVYPMHTKTRICTTWRKVEYQALDE